MLCLPQTGYGYNQVRPRTGSEVTFLEESCYPRLSIPIMAVNEGLHVGQEQAYGIPAAAAHQLRHGNGSAIQVPQGGGEVSSGWMCPSTRVEASAGKRWEPAGLDSMAQPAQGPWLLWPTPKL